MSIAGMSMSPEQTSATVYTDAYSILQHRNVVEMVLSSCRPMFSDLSMGLGAEAARMLREQGRAGETLFSYLPAPAFMSAGEQLFDDILRDNEITGAAASRLREINRTAAGPGGEPAHRRTRRIYPDSAAGRNGTQGRHLFYQYQPIPSGEKKGGGFTGSLCQRAQGNWPCAWKRFRPTVCFWPQMLTTSVFLP